MMQHHQAFKRTLTPILVAGGLLASPTWAAPKGGGGKGGSIASVGLDLGVQSLAYNETSQDLEISGININPKLFFNIAFVPNRLVWNSSFTYTVYGTPDPSLGTLMGTSGLQFYVANKTPGFVFGLGGGGAFFKHNTDNANYGIQQILSFYGELILGFNNGIGRQFLIKSRLLILSTNGLGPGTNSVWSSDLVIPFTGSGGRGVSLLFQYEKSGFDDSTVTPFVFEATSFGGGLRFVL